MFYLNLSTSFSNILSKRHLQIKALSNILHMVYNCDPNILITEIYLLMIRFIHQNERSKERYDFS